MIIIGCDYHPGFQQIAFVDTETGDYGEQRLEHSEGAEKFYRDLAAQGKKVRVGMEASGHARWFERLLAELNFEFTGLNKYDQKLDKCIGLSFNAEGKGTWCDVQLEAIKLSLTADFSTP